MRAAARPLSERLVLVVDDEPVVCGMTARILREAGLRVQQAHDGLEALELLLTQGPAVFGLVISDIAMPHLTGEQLARILADRWPGLPLLLISGQGGPAPNYAGVFLAKPFTSEELLSSVAGLLRPEAAGRP